MGPRSRWAGYCWATGARSYGNPGPPPHVLLGASDCGRPGRQAQQRVREAGRAGAARVCIQSSGGTGGRGWATSTQPLHSGSDR